MNELLKRVFSRISPYTLRARRVSETLWGKFNHLSKRERNISIVATAVLMVVTADFAVVRPLKSSLASLDHKIKDTENLVLRNLKVAGQKPELDKVYQRMQESMQDSHANDEEIRSSMLKDIESLARENGIYLSEVKPQVSNETPRFKEFAVRVQMECRMEPLMRFLADILKRQKLYTVDSFRITPHPEDVHKIKATVTLSRVVFR